MQGKLKKAGVSSFENTPAHYAEFPYSVVYGGSNPSSMPKMADVICEIEGAKNEGKKPWKGRCHAALTVWHLYTPKILVETRGIEPLTS